jgi:hypothetical protein
MTAKSAIDFIATPVRTRSGAVGMLVSVSARLALIDHHQPGTNLPPRFPYVAFGFVDLGRESKYFPVEELEPVQ